MMNKITTQTRDRRTYLGGSEVAAVLGVPGAYGSAWDVWARRQPDFEAESGATPAHMEAGTRMEASVAKWVADLRGADFFPGEPWGGAVAVGPEPWAACHPDGYLRDHADNSWWVYEGKLASRSRHLFGDDGQMPAHYLVQWVWEQMCTRMPGVFGAWTDMGSAPWVHSMERDLDLEGMLLDKTGAWWHRHIVQGEMPALDASPAAHAWLQRAYRDHGSTVRPATPEEAATIMELAQARAEEKALDGTIKRLEAAVKQAIGEDAGGAVGGGSVTLKSQAGP